LPTLSVDGATSVVMSTTVIPKASIIVGTAVNAAVITGCVLPMHTL
jgi:hypothetical protein